MSHFPRAKLNDTNLEAYLRDILTRSADGHPMSRIDELMPWTTPGWCPVGTLGAPYLRTKSC